MREAEAAVRLREELFRCAAAYSARAGQWLCVRFDEEAAATKIITPENQPLLALAYDNEFLRRYLLRAFSNEIYRGVLGHVFEHRYNNGQTWFHDAPLVVHRYQKTLSQAINAGADDPSAEASAVIGVFIRQLCMVCAVHLSRGVDRYGPLWRGWNRLRTPAVIPDRPRVLHNELTFVPAVPAVPVVTAAAAVSAESLP